MPERRTLNRTYSVGDQVPTCPVFTRAKIKSRSGILVDLPSHYTVESIQHEISQSHTSVRATKDMIEKSNVYAT